MKFLSKADQAFLLGAGAAIVSKKPMLRQQGNGNWTGFVRKTYADGVVTDCEFIINAKSRDDVRDAYRQQAVS